MDLSLSQISQIRALVGEISQEQLSDVDAFVIDDFAIFLPVVGPCRYSITPDHSHPAYMFIITTGDNTAIALADERIECEYGRLYAFSPGIVHHEVVEQGFARYIAIFMDPQLFEERLSHYGASHEMRCASLDCPAGLRDLVNDFMLEYGSGLPGRSELLQSITIRIVHELARCCAGVVPKGRARIQTLQIERTVDHIQQNYAEPLTVEDLAAMAGMSLSSFRRHFKEQLGLPPQDYILDLRLKKAQRHLVATAENITEIAYACGFGSHAHFAATFKSHFNLSPSVYRKLHRL